MEPTELTLRNQQNTSKEFRRVNEIKLYEIELYETAVIDFPRIVKSTVLYIFKKYESELMLETLKRLIT